MFNDDITKKLAEAASKIMVGEGVEENLSEDITPAQLKSVEDTADAMLKKYKLDVEFTKHFIDRVNDDRNSPEINANELIALFAKIAKNKGRQVKRAEDVEAVIKDLTSNLNLPVVVNRLGKMDFEMVAKTIMRKKNFQINTKRNKVIKYESTDASEIETLEEGKVGKTVEEIKQMFQKFKGKELPMKMVKVLQDIVAKFDDNVDMLKKLVRANIPYVSLTAIGRLTWKHKISPSVARSMLPESFELNEMAYPHMMFDPDSGDAVEVNDEDEHEEYAEMGWVHEKPEIKKEESKLDKFTHIFCEETEELPKNESVELEEANVTPQKISDEDLNKIFDSLKSKQKVDIWFDSGIRKGTEYVQFEVGRRSHSKKYNVDTITFKRVGSESRLKYFLYRYNNRGGRIAFAAGDMAAPLIDIRMSQNESVEESVELEEANVKGMSDDDLKDIQKLIKTGDADLPKDVLKAIKDEIENRNLKEESDEEEELEEKKSKKKEIKVRVNPEGMMGSASRPHKSKKGKGSYSRREKHQGKKDY